MEIRVNTYKAEYAFLDIGWWDWSEVFKENVTLTIDDEEMSVSGDFVADGNPPEGGLLGKAAFRLGQRIRASLLFGKNPVLKIRWSDVVKVRSLAPQFLGDRSTDAIQVDGRDQEGKKAKIAFAPKSDNPKRFFAEFTELEQLIRQKSKK